MLPDFERKLLRIMYNYSLKYRKMPEMRELQRLTGRHRSSEIENALLWLENHHYISWENKSYAESVRIIQGWEQESEGGPEREQRSRAEYWTRD